MTGSLAFVFPGQGSQAVGMGADLCRAYATARNTFQEADEALGFALSGLCFNGPAEELVKTINVQPAVLAVSVACLRATGEASARRLPAPAFVAGHSLGEYTALVAAGAIDFGDALRLVRERGRLMQMAGEKNPGGMLAVLGLSEAAVEEICVRSGAGVANLNCPGQIVVSGTPSSLDQAREIAKAAGAKAVPLKVSGAFHSPLMEPAVSGLREALGAYRFLDPTVPVISNVTARPLTAGKEIKDELLSQLNHRVQWQRSVEAMVAGGATTFLEIGPGEVLTGLIKRTAPGVQTCHVGDVVSLQAALAAVCRTS